MFRQQKFSVYVLIWYFLRERPKDNESSILPPEKAAVAIFAVTSLMIDAAAVVKYYAQIEASMVSWERTYIFNKIDAEENYKSFDKDIKNLQKILKRGNLEKEDIIKEGEVEFQQISARYNKQQEMLLLLYRFPLPIKV